MKIAAKISLSFLATAVIVTTIAASIFYSIVKNTLEKDIGTRLDSAVYSRTQHIKTYLQMLKTSIGQLSKSVVLENVLHAKNDKKAFDIAMQRLKRTKEANPSISDFMLLDTNGKIIASTNEKYIGMDKSRDAYFTAGQKQFFIKDACYSEEAKESALVTSCPFLDSKTGELVGVLAAEIKLGELYRITTDSIGLGETGEIIIVNKDGFLITPSRFLKDTFLKQKIDTKNFWACILQRNPKYDHSAETRVLTCPDYRGVMIIGAHVYIPEMQWAVLGKMDVSEAQAPLKILYRIYIIILIMAPFLAWLFGVYLSGFIAGPIRKLQAGVKIVGSGNLDYRVGIKAKDEIGELSRVFDKMAGDLKHTTTSVDNLNKEIAERKQAQEKLKEAKVFIESTLNSITDIFYTVDLDGKFLNWNKTFSKVTGYNDQELSSKKALDLFSGKDIQIISEAIEKIFKEGASKAEANFVLKDGRQLPYEFTGSILKDAQGNIIGFSGTGRDLTERKNAEKMLLESERRLKAIFNSTFQFTGLMTLDGTLIEANQSAIDFTGLKSEDVVNRPFWEAHWWKGNEERVQKLKESIRLAASGKFIRYEVELQGAGNIAASFDFSIKPILGPDDKVIFLVPEGRDITERKKIEKELANAYAGLEDKIRERTAELRQSEDSLRTAFSYARSLLEASLDPLMTISREGKIMDVNEATIKVTGVAKEKLVGTDFLDYFTEPEKARKGYQEAFNEGFVSDYPLTIRHKDGKLTDVLYNATVYKDDKGKVLGVFAAARDVTELNILQDKLIRSEKLAIVGKLASSVAHELRNPLGVMKNAIYYLNMMELVKNNPDIKENMEIISSEIENSDKIISDLLEFSRIKKPDLKPEEINLIIKETLNRVRAPDGIKVVTELAENLPRIQVDALQMQQVFYNLARNAMQAMEKGGILTISSCVTRGCEASPQGDENIAIAFKDTGCGIPKENLQKIFEPLFSTKAKGTGLGLSVVASLVEGHGGKIEIESEVNKGSTFTVKLPIKVG